MAYFPILKTKVQRSQDLLMDNKFQKIFLLRYFIVTKADHLFLVIILSPL